ncbi:hypothetical protein C8R43DRAFT_965719 [Mycena crocata]|nr:hypothetical protein C8R43DRAFT_965719 [Mycena crocata]
MGAAAAVTRLKSTRRGCKWLVKVWEAQSGCKRKGVVRRTDNATQHKWRCRGQAGWHTQGRGGIAQGGYGCGWGAGRASQAKRAGGAAGAESAPFLFLSGYYTAAGYEKPVGVDRRPRAQGAGSELARCWRGQFFLPMQDANEEAWGEDMGTGRRKQARQAGRSGGRVELLKRDIVTVFLPHDCLFGGLIAHADGRPSLRPPVNNADGWGEKTTYRIAMLTDFREKVVYINGQNQPKWIGHLSSYATLLFTLYQQLLLFSSCESDPTL